MSILKIINFMNLKRGYVYHLELKLLKTNSGRQIYLYLYLFCFVIVILCSVLFGLIGGWVMNQSMIHVKDNDTRNYISGVLWSLFVSSFLWVQILIRNFQIKKNKCFDVVL